MNRGAPAPAANFASLLDRITLLQLALVISIGAHALLLTIRFVAPDSFLFKPSDHRLDVILVNAKSKTSPAQETALAQANLDGGGLYDEGRPTSFLPRSLTSKDGEALKETRPSEPQPEVVQQRSLTVDQSTSSVLNPSKATDTEAPTRTLNLSESISAVARMEAQIARQNEDYSQRPKRGFIGPSTRAVSYAMYYSQWKDKIERVGTVNYPEEARGKIYGDLILTVTLNPDGSIYKDQVNVTRSSGFTVLDRAAMRIVRLAAPYGPFSDEMRKEYDVFEIITKFSFTRSDGFEANIQK